MKTHKDLDAWKVAIEFVTTIYQSTKSFPSEEKYSLTDQIRRAAVSIPSNIAEGAARGSDSEFIRFLYYALGSSAELDTQLIIANNLEYISDDKFPELSEGLERIGRMVNGLIKYLKNK